MTQHASNLAALFEQTASLHPDREAIFLSGGAVRYADLARKARWLARTLHQVAGDGARVAIFADRSLGSYVSVLATLYAGGTYVPVSPVYPAARNAAILAASGAAVLVYQRSSAAALQALLAELPAGVTPIELDSLEDAPEEDDARPGWLPPALAAAQAGTPPAKPAYILFTSGSTGRPKGVPISHASVLHYLTVLGEQFDFKATDRHTQNFELTFDLSVFDLFVPWRHGGAFCVPSALDAATPYQYLKRHGITVWFSVPSAVQILQRNRLLKPGSFPTLRISLFCGEALTWDAAHAWAQAAPQSVIANLYGPTELTISCFTYRLPSPLPAAPTGRPIVPIGQVHAGHVHLVLQEDGTPAGPGREGELCIAGPQQFPGYLDDPAKSEAAHVLKAGADGAWRVYYRTGDLVSEDEAGIVHYLGRIDHQVKVNGYRVELEEIERAIRRLPGSPNAVVRYTRNPVSTDQQRKLVAFLTGDPRDDREILRELARTLPHYMLPDVIIWAGETFPLNGNGKVDVNSLLATVA